MKEFGKNVKLLRRKQGLTQQQLADMVKMKQAAISKIENDSMTISLDKAIDIADKLGVDIGDLIPAQTEVA